jgi:hypothetical protein
VENVLEFYTELYNRRRPLVYFDELPMQLVTEVLPPLSVPHQAAREDYGYACTGMANVFVVCEPQHGWWYLSVTALGCKLDFASEMRWLVDVSCLERDPGLARAR